MKIKMFFIKIICVVLGFFMMIGGFITNDKYKQFAYWESIAATKLFKEEVFFEDWSPEQKFDRKYAVELKKDPDKDFVIVNFTDTQLVDAEVNGEHGELMRKTIDAVIKKTKPDLITITGDNAWQTGAYLDFVKVFSSYGIPWAPIMGNHDGQGCPSEYWIAALLQNSKNCLFKFGPKDMGYGNYIINITQNSNILHTLFMTDTHSEAVYSDGKGGTFEDYDHLWKNQFEWYRWAVNGIKNIEGKTVESTVFMHIPVYEMNAAFEMAAYDPLTERFGNKSAFGVVREPICSPPVNTGFFGVCKELDSTKNIICGHDHKNSCSVLYNGIRLTYGLKCGAGCYWSKDLNGATQILVNSEGKASVQHIFIDPADIGMPDVQ